jgi:hypothetical protein
MTGEDGFQGRNCAYCGDVLGVYEPIVVTIRGQHAGRTSLAAVGGLPEDGVVLMHERCHDFDAASRRAQ